MVTKMDMDKDRMERFIWTEENGDSLLLITNDKIQCRDCVHRTEPMVIECEIYEEKPGYVIDNAKPCKHYEKK